MKQIAPSYYTAFKCIAGACRHSCCIGWEIDIDPDSLDRFQNVQGALGQRLKENIDISEEGACFRLQGKEERCPFLNTSGLCDLILELGEDALCQICTDHPRFRNFYSDRTEIGLGLCCEAAGQLILSHKEPMQLITLKDDGADEPADPAEQQLLAIREQLFTLMQDRSVPMSERAAKLLDPSAINWTDWADFLSELERLDERWAQLLEYLPKEPEHPLSPALELPLEQLMVTLLYRHLPGALEDGDTEGRVIFCALMWQMITRLCRHLHITRIDDLAEIARLYSSELEYSQDNTCAILDRIAETLA